MHLRRALAAATLASLPLLCSRPALAYFDTFVNNTVMGSMNQAESAAFAKAMRQVLDEGQDGTPAPWSVGASKGRAAITGSITPVRTKTDQGQQCRQIRTELERGTNHDQWSNWFCKQPDGRWRSRKVQGE